MWQHSHRSVTASATDHCFHLGIEPHAHEVFRAALVLGALKSAGCAPLGVQYHAVTRALERFDPTSEPSGTRRVRRGDHADYVAFGERRRPQEWLAGLGL